MCVLGHNVNIWTESECGADFLAQKLEAGGSCLHCLMVNPPLLVHMKAKSKLSNAGETDKLTHARAHTHPKNDFLPSAQHTRQMWNEEVRREEFDPNCKSVSRWSWCGRHRMAMHAESSFAKSSIRSPNKYGSTLIYFMFQEKLYTDTSFNPFNASCCKFLLFEGSSAIPV